MQAGDNEDRFRRLYERYYRTVVAYLAGCGLPRDDAREVAQDVFVRVYRSMDSYRGESEWTFLKVTAQRAAMNWFRTRNAAKRKVVTIPLEDVTEGDVEVRSTDPLGEAYDAKLLNRKLQAAIGQLPKGTRDCLLLRLRDLTYTEIQGIMGISMDAVKSRLRDARNRLRTLLTTEPEGVQWPDDDDDQEK